MTHSTWSLIADGLFVGFGARLGSGCTSGHGVARISPHSLMADVATIGQHLGNLHPAEALPAGTTGTACVVPAAAVSSTVLAAAGRPIVTSSPEEAAITAERRR